MISGAISRIHYAEFVKMPIYLFRSHRQTRITKVELDLSPEKPVLSTIVPRLLQCQMRTSSRLYIVFNLLD
ncbi:hypothetical protein AHF37_04722 [Paragonimus kellicotti]|nr:hypothetical protein AHF37_04722 [Paragonimus kellicotti]